MSGFKIGDRVIRIKGLKDTFADDSFDQDFGDEEICVVARKQASALGFEGKTGYYDDYRFRLYEAAPVAEATKPNYYDINIPGHKTFDVIDLAAALGLGLCTGSALKYLVRCNLKHPDPVPDLKKAVEFLQREIRNRERK